MTLPDVVLSPAAESERATDVPLFEQVCDHLCSGIRTRMDDETVLHMARAAAFH